MINKKLQVFTLLSLGFTSLAYGQIQEEKLVLERKREPEVRKIEKKQTSVVTDKNYPPKEKKTQDSINLRYNITDVPAVSDFRTSKIKGQDLAPDFKTSYQNNYVRVGAGSYGKFLADGIVSGYVQDATEVGVEAHYLSTTGLEKDYPWSSSQNRTDAGIFLNHYGNLGKINVTANAGFNDYNLYGLYAMEAPASADLTQRYSKVAVNGYYDHYSDEILDDLRVKTSFLTDHFNAKESLANIAVNLAKKDVPWAALQDTSIDFGLGLDVSTQKTSFNILDHNDATFLKLAAVPAIRFSQGESYLRLGAELAYLTKDNSAKTSALQKTNSSRWFPKVEVLFAADEAAKFYAGIDGGIVLNSYAEMLSRNPYLLSDQILNPTVTKYRVYFGIKGDISQTAKYDLSGGYGKVKDMLFFAHNGLFNTSMTAARPAYDYANTFSAVYGDGSVSTVKGSVSLFPLQNLDLKGGLTYTKYDVGSLKNVYNLDNMQLDLSAGYTLMDKKLLLGVSGLYSMGNKVNIYEVKASDTAPRLYENRPVNYHVKSFIDLNASAEYKFHKNFSIFALGNNLLNSRYQLYHNYKVLGAQILGGIKLSF